MVCLVSILRRNSTNTAKEAARPERITCGGAQQVGCLFQHVWCTKSVPTEVNGSAGLERTSMGDSASHRISFKPNPQHRDRVRRSVTSAAGCAPEHPRPAASDCSASEESEKAQRELHALLSSAVAQRHRCPSTTACVSAAVEYQNWECCCSCGLFFYLKATSACWVRLMLL